MEGLERVERTQGLERSADRERPAPQRARRSARAGGVCTEVPQTTARSLCIPRLLLHDPPPGEPLRRFPPLPRKCPNPVDQSLCPYRRLTICLGTCDFQNRKKSESSVNSLSFVRSSFIVSIGFSSSSKRVVSSKLKFITLP